MAYKPCWMRRIAFRAAFSLALMARLSSLAGSSNGCIGFDLFSPSPITCPVLILGPKSCRSHRRCLCFPYLNAVHMGSLTGLAPSYTGSLLCPILPCLAVSPVLCICAHLVGTLGAGSRTGSEATWPLASAPASTPVPDSTPSRRSSLTSGRPARADDSGVGLTFLGLHSTGLICHSAGIYLPVKGLPPS